MQRQEELDLAGKVVIITGASRGIGRQAAQAFARRGAHLVLAARTVEPDAKLPGTLNETLTQIENMGASAITVPTDLASSADLKRLVDAAVERSVASTCSSITPRPPAARSGPNDFWS